MDMRRGVDVLLARTSHRWEEVDVDSDPELARRYGDAIPILFVNGRLQKNFAWDKTADLARGGFAQNTSYQADVELGFEF